MLSFYKKFSLLLFASIASLSFVSWWLYILGQGLEASIWLHVFPIIISFAAPVILYYLTEVDIKTKSEKRFEEGLIAYNEKNYPKAIQIWRPLAEKKKHPEAQCRIAMMYEEGICLIKDLEKAEEWYRKAANQGHAQSQNNLGYMYRQGLGVEKNVDEAVKWYRKASAQGNVEGKNNLALIYAQGLGTGEIDYKQALKLYKQAADLGLATAQSNIGAIYYGGTIDGKPNYEEAVRWFKQAAKQGNELAQYNLGVMYSLGLGELEQSSSHAYKWLYLASKQEDEIAQEAIYALKFMMDDKEIAEAKAMAEKCIATNYEECGE